MATRFRHRENVRCRLRIESQRICQQTSSAKYNRQLTKWPFAELRRSTEAELLSLLGALRLRLTRRSKRQRPGTTTTRRNEMRLTQIHWQRRGVFAGVSVADDCFSTRLLSYRGLGYVTCRHFWRLLVMQAEKFHEPSLFW